MKRILLSCLAAVLLISASALGGCATKSTPPARDELIDLGDMELIGGTIDANTQWQVNDTIQVGAYTFTAYAVEEDKTLLVCDTTLGEMPFHNVALEKATWAKSSLCEYLNTTFLEALDTTVKSILDTAPVVTPKSAVSGGGGCTAENCPIFVLSYEEVQKYDIPAIPGTDCWLRTTGEELTHAMVHKGDNTIQLSGYRSDFSVAAVRPAMWVRANNGQQETYVELDRATVGSLVPLGSYGGETVIWSVLAKEGGKALLMTRDVIEVMPFHTTNDVTYANSQLAAWLNGTFKTTALAEHLAIIDTAHTVVTPANPTSGVAGGSDSQGIFVMSTQEFEKYCADTMFATAEATEYAKANGVYTDPMMDTAGYWLRTAGKDAATASYVMYYGQVAEDGALKESAYIGVRPAMWVSVE